MASRRSPDVKIKLSSCYKMPKRTERLSWINDEHRHQNHAVMNFRDVDAAISEDPQVTGKNLDPLRPEPHLSDYNHPSNDQRQIQCLRYHELLTPLASGPKGPSTTSRRSHPSHSPGSSKRFNGWKACGNHRLRPLHSCFKNRSFPEILIPRGEKVLPG